MDGVDVSHLIQTIDGYLCELGLAQIRDGLHSFGEAPEGAALVDMLISLTRLPNLEAASLPEEIARLLGFDFSVLMSEKGKKLDALSLEKLGHLGAYCGRPLFTHGDVLEGIEQIARAIFEGLQAVDFRSAEMVVVLEQVVDFLPERAQLLPVLEFACRELVPRLSRTGEEISNLLKGLSGEYIPAGPSGAPTRGMAHILPTGRNFYSVDPRALPASSAWLVGEKLAREVLQRHKLESGHYPESVCITMWGTSAMRTQGDDIAEVLALMGVRPLWRGENRRVVGLELIPLAELGRPRIDVTVRISGFFRDAFPHLVDLMNEAVGLVLAAEEDLEQNYLKKHFSEDLRKMKTLGFEDTQAVEHSQLRVFGSKPGSYGAGILPLINEKNWSNQDDFAQAFINWGGYGYAGDGLVLEAKEDYKNRLSQVQIALHNQDNREHDIFDSDDYLQYHGGMIATIFSLTGSRPKHYFGDTQDPSSAKVRDLKEEVLRVYRSRVVNPKWIESIQRHGYKGGLELTATLDYVFGYDATAGIMEDWMYEGLAQEYALSETMQEFLKANNPWALSAISERLLEAAGRLMWQAPRAETLEALQALYLESEAVLEARGEKTSHNSVKKG
jgi:cobaltochelatase CobN